MCLQCRRPWFYPIVGKMYWRRDRLPTPIFLGFPCSSAGKESACNVGDQGSIPGLARSPGEGNGNPLHCSCLENPRDGQVWWAAIYGVAQSQTQLKWLSSSSRNTILEFSKSIVFVIQKNKSIKETAFNIKNAERYHKFTSEKLWIIRQCLTKWITVNRWFSSVLSEK